MLPQIDQPKQNLPNKIFQAKPNRFVDFRDKICVPFYNFLVLQEILTSHYNNNKDLLINRIKNSLHYRDSVRIYIFQINMINLSYKDGFYIQQLNLKC